MPPTPFEIAFQHYEDCPQCNYAEHRLCDAGRALFRAAHDLCVKLASVDLETPKASA